MTLTFTVPGEPQGKARPRVTKRVTYTPKRTKEYQQRVRAAFLASSPTAAETGTGYLAALHSGPVRLEIVAYMKRPKSHYLRGKVRDSAPVWPLKKPDFDNIEKAIADALNGLAYRDDAQIIDSHCLKMYQLEGFGPCVQVSVIFMAQETIREHAEKGASRCRTLGQ